MRVTVTWHSAGPNTIWGKLTARLGREPTNAEAAEEVKRIMEDATVDLAGAGKLQHQRRK